ncbi:EAL domain-containing protein [Crenothrix sp.]|uniref:EAL domain-containing protein n=1 Tax=Crenothrix sp. TaxID=3100433 RepID=UPI00374DDCFF
MPLKIRKYCDCASTLAVFITLFVTTVAQANDLLPTTLGLIKYPTIMSSTDQMISYLIVGFSLGIIAYHLILYSCTRQSIYLRFSVALLGYVVGVGEGNGLWHLAIGSHDSAVLVLDTLNLVLFISFFEHFLNLFVDFKGKHPLITRGLHTCAALGIVLIVGNLLFPHPIFLVAYRVVIVMACLIGILTPHCWYPTIKHLRTFITTVLLFLIVVVYYHISPLIVDNNHIPFMYHLSLASGTLMFLSFSSIINMRFNYDREQVALAQKMSIQSLEKYQILYHNALESLFTTFIDGRLLQVNPALQKLLAVKFVEQPIINQSFLHSYFAEPENVWKKITQGLKQHGTVEALEIQGPDNTWYSLSARHISANDIDLIEGSIIDISQRKQQELQLAYLAKRDPLTGLHNRNAFENYLQEAISSQITHTLLFIDLDQFKVINDTCGHVAGDEFGIIFYNQNQAVGKASAERIRLALEANHFQWVQRIFKTSASIGLITLDAHITSGEKALSLADAACYEAKDAGRNRVLINDPDKQVTIYRQSQMDMVATLTQALRDHQLTLFQQPIISLTPQPTHLQHYEVLVRLHTDNGLLAPGAFLPAAQRYHLLPQIDRWVFNRTCAWLIEGDNLVQSGMVNINLSPQTLADPLFVAFIRKCLLEHNISPAKICFEITEYSAINNFSLVLRNILKLRELGFRFALDDFGSGFASFDHVKRLPVDVIKIDGRFIRELKHDATNKTLVRAVTEIAHTLGKQVTAESIEDQETADILRGLNVDFGQGYYFGRPAALYGQEPLPVTQFSCAV